MSTYLIAMVIGEYDVISTQSGDGSGVPQSVYYPIIFDEKKAQSAIELSVRILNHFDILFGIRYQEQFPKLDSIGISDFAAGGLCVCKKNLYKKMMKIIIMYTQKQKSNGKLGINYI